MESKESIKTRVASVRARKAEAGLKKVEVWCFPEGKAKVKSFDKSYLIEKKKTGRPAKEKKMKWKDDLRGMFPSSDLRLQNLYISIHGYVGCGDEKFLSCSNLGISRKSLNETDLEIAKIKAIIIIKEIINDLKKSLDGLD